MLNHKMMIRQIECKRSKQIDIVFHQAMHSIEVSLKDWRIHIDITLIKVNITFQILNIII